MLFVPFLPPLVMLALLSMVGQQVGRNRYLVVIGDDR
jgi:hypothetical protein